MRPVETQNRGLAIITGAPSGIGAATALSMANIGYQLLLAARRSERLPALAERITAEGRGATEIETDITSDAAVTALTSAATSSSAELGVPLTVLVNNAGGPFGLEPVADADFKIHRGSAP